MDDFYIDKTLIALVIISTIVVAVLIYRDHANHITTKDIYQLAVEEYIDDAAAASLSSSCRSQDDEVSCVMNSNRIAYVNANSSAIKSPSDVLKTGGNCKDIAVFYGIIFTRLNYTTKFIFPVPQHTALQIRKQISENSWKYCNVELNQATCYEVQL